MENESNSTETQAGDSLPESVYLPPYDSPIEDIFAYTAVKRLATSVVLTPQVTVQTIAGNFRLDFVLTHSDFKIGIECDGKQFHDHARDNCRDTFILGTGQVDAIFRLRGNDIFYRIDDCLYLMSLYYPSYFSKRGMSNLERLCGSEALNADSRKPFVYLDHEPENKTDIPWNIRFECRSHKKTDYYYFMHANMWEIAKFHRLFTIEMMLKHFADIPEAIETHYKMINGFTSGQQAAYHRIMKDMQTLLYPNPTDPEPVKPK
jgi:very-short-patch-repair endonuclease